MLIYTLSCIFSGYVLLRTCWWKRSNPSTLYIGFKYLVTRCNVLSTPLARNDCYDSKENLELVLEYLSMHTSLLNSFSLNIFLYPQFIGYFKLSSPKFGPVISWATAVNISSK